jgi:purine nucleosidase
MSPRPLRVSSRRTALLPVWVLVFLCFGVARALAATPVILSTDVGNEIDDQWAIAYMLTDPEFDVRGIISAHAPSLPAPSAHATYLVLRDEVENRLGLRVHPPLFEGSSLPLADTRTPRPNPGVDFLLKQSQAFNEQNRLTVLTIGAATDVASALLLDPTLADRIRIVAMGFENSGPHGGEEYNVQNDPRAWQVLLRSRAPIVIGAGDVCRKYLALGFDQARSLIAGHGPVGLWLWDEYQAWYYRQVKPLRVDDFSRPWIIWDIVTLAYLRGLTTQETAPRPELRDDLSLAPAPVGPTGASAGTVQWITSVDAGQLWSRFTRHLDSFERTHDVTPADCAQPAP